jgi:hypothetical protein
MENARTEFDRLLTTLYAKSDSPIVSPLVIAPKSTYPFQRWCGDYKWINLFIKHTQCYVPIVFKELEKAASGKVFCDLDMTHAFHQIPLADYTAKLLSVLTPWGSVYPKFMPEGISPASGILHTVMVDILKDMLYTSIAIFDNFLIVCDTYDDCYNKFVQFITICASRNIILGMPKSKIGFTSCVFFGYEIKGGTYQLTQSRKDSVASLVFPKTVKQVQSFLGSTVFFRNNIVNFASKSAPLNDMTKKGFSWDTGTWTQDYIAIFEAFKGDILNAIAITFPDYNATFLLRTDASDVAWGGILLQVKDGGVFECISLASGKFTDAAKKWGIQKKELFAIVASVKHMDYILTGKYFIIETDNKNITYLNSDTNSITVRWRQYLQTFFHCIRFLPGKYNTSDWLTRQYSLFHMYTAIVDDDDDVISSVPIDSCDISVCTDVDEFTKHILFLLVNSPLQDDPPQVRTVLSVTDMFASVHGGKNFHRGALATFNDLNVRYPGHKVPIQVIRDMVAECPTCQKVRIGMKYNLPEEHLHLKPKHFRQRIGIDTLQVTPRDVNGNICCVVIVEHFSKFVGIYPAKDHSAIEMAKACFLHFTRYGRFEEVYSDPGSDLTSEIIRYLHVWLGQKHVFSLVDRHESNGVEPTNKKILSLARCLIHDERLIHKWSDDNIISLIQHQCNAMPHSETGFSAFELKFGTLDKPYMILPDDALLHVDAPDILHKLNDDIKNVRDISSQWQQNLVSKRDNSVHTLNKYQPGDFVLFEFSVDNVRVNKLDAKFLGPFLVISHVRNDVSVRNLVTDVVSTFHCNRVKPFIGSPEEAKEAALRDADQYYIDAFLAYRGDPQVRSSIMFYIRFADSCCHWKPWSKDLYDTQQYEIYCSSLPQLSPLIVMHKESLILKKQLNQTAITSVESGTIVYMDLRALGAGLYELLHLPDDDFSTYVVPLEYLSFQNSLHTKVNCIVPLLDLRWTGRNAVSHSFVKWWGSLRQVSAHMTIINHEFIREYNIINILQKNN